MHVLAVNCGSSSLKFKVVEIGSDQPAARPPARAVLRSGTVEEIGGRATLTLGGSNTDRLESQQDIRGHAAAERAVALFCYRAKKYLGAYLAVLGGADALAFSGGIGERAPAVRARICEGMAWCGLRIDQRRNAAVTRVPDGEAVSITEPEGAWAAYVVHVDEETWIARETMRCLGR